MANAYNTRSSNFWMLLIILAALFMFGGSSRDDVQSLAILSPILILGCGLAISTLKLEHWKKYKSVLGFYILICTIVVFYLTLQPHTLFVSADIGNTVRSISSASQMDQKGQWIPMAPADTWGALTFLLGSLSVMLLSVQLPRDDLMFTVPLFIMAGVISGLLGMMQLISGVDEQLYPYQITNSGSAVGLFANRNHAAVFLATLFPLLAFFSLRAGMNSRQNGVRRIVACSIAIMLVPLILVTGSRSGLLAATLGLVGAFFIYTNGNHASDRASAVKPVTLVAPIVLAGLVFLSIYFARAEAIDRFFYESAVDNNRKDFWQVAVKQFWSFYPFGFGPGSFVAVYQIDEPIFLLEAPYLNRLHNDWLEIALTFGVLGIVILLTGMVWYVGRAFQLWVNMDAARSSVLLGRMASIVIAIFALASMSDYPMRTPVLAGFATLALVWFAHARDDSAILGE